MKDISTNLIRLNVSISFTTMVTVHIKLRVFQYKILSNIIFVNNMLFKFRKVESQLCSFFKAEDGTYMHLFYMYRKTSIL